MTKLLLASASLLAFITVANAQDGFHPYIGVDYAGVANNYSDKKIPTNSASDIFEDSTTGIVPYVGAQFNENFGVEVSYLKTEGAEKKNVLNTGVTTTYELQGVAADLMFALPMSPKLDLLASAGIGLYQADITASAAGIGTVSGNTGESVGLKAGLGLRYLLTDHIGLRAMGEYINIGDSNSLESVILGHAGMYLVF